MKKDKSTYEKFIEGNPKRKSNIEKARREIFTQEIILALMEEDEVSVRQLAKLTGLSTSVIQDLRSGTQKSTSVNNFAKILRSLGAELVVRKNRKILATI